MRTGQFPEIDSTVYAALYLVPHPTYLVYGKLPFQDLTGGLSAIRAVLKLTVMWAYARVFIFTADLLRQIYVRL